MIIDIISKVLEQQSSQPESIKIGYIKEVLQADILDFLYRTAAYKDLVFYGWTAMRFLLWLNRFSEDLDFIWPWFDSYELLWQDIKNYFAKQNIAIDYKIQKFRTTLKFRDFLDQFGLKFGNSKDLYIKIEVSDHFDFCKKYTIKQYPIIYQNKSMLIKSLDEWSLFATKINAVLYRQRTKKSQEWEIAVKWRDFYDLFRYLQKNIKPNIDCIQWIDNITMLKNKLIEIVTYIDFTHIVTDITPFVEDPLMLEFIKNNGKKHILEKIDAL